MRDHLHHRALHAEARGFRIALVANQHQRDENAEGDEAHVRDRRIRDQLLHVFLHQRDQADVDHSDEAQRDHQPGEFVARIGRDRQAETQEAVAADLQHDRRQDHRAAGRRLDVRVGQPGVDREHRHLHRERDQEGKEQPHLLLRIQRQRIQIRQLPAAGLQIQVDQPDQHEHRAEEGIEEELHRRVDTARTAPDADDDEHRDQHAFEEHVEQHRVDGGEHADHQAFQEQEGRDVLVHALVDGAPRTDQHQRGRQRGQHDQRDRNAVRAEVVLDVVGGNPLALFNELQAGGEIVESGEQRNAQRERRHRDRQRQPTRGLRPLIAERQRQCAADDGQPDQDAEKRPIVHRDSVSVSSYRLTSKISART